MAVVFFNEYASWYPRNAICLKRESTGSGLFLPVLSHEVVHKGTFFFVALTLLNLLQVSPRPEHLQLVITAGRVWFTAHPDAQAFWVEHGVGPRLCSIIEHVSLLIRASLREIRPPGLRSNACSLTLFGSASATRTSWKRLSV